MPLYDYVCQNCEKHFEAIVPLKEWDKQQKCKYCGDVLIRICVKPPRVASWNYINGSKVMG
jgi:putative FmdB family regulatory protein